MLPAARRRAARRKRTADRWRSTSAQSRSGSSRASWRRWCSAARCGRATRSGRARRWRSARASGRRSDPDLEHACSTRASGARGGSRPIDTLPAATQAEWALAAALHDVLHAANPAFDAALRRSAAARILELGPRGDRARARAGERGRGAVAAHLVRARARRRADRHRRVLVDGLAHVPGRRAAGAPAGVARAAARERRGDAARAARARAARGGARAARRRGGPPAHAHAADGPRDLHAGGAGVRVGRRRRWRSWRRAPGRTLVLRALARLPAADVDAALGRATRELLATRRARRPRR